MVWKWVYLLAASMNISQFFLISGPFFTKSPPAKNITSFQSVWGKRPVAPCSLMKVFRI
jgi:hypothetical protein